MAKRTTCTEGRKVVSLRRTIRHDVIANAKRLPKRLIGSRLYIFQILQQTMKKFYSEPKAKIVEINDANIIATSYPRDPEGIIPDSGEDGE